MGFVGKVCSEKYRLWIWTVGNHELDYAPEIVSLLLCLKMLMLTSQVKLETFKHEFDIGYFVHLKPKVFHFVTFVKTSCICHKFNKKKNQECTSTFK